MQECLVVSFGRVAQIGWNGSIEPEYSALAGNEFNYTAVLTCCCRDAIQRRQRPITVGKEWSRSITAVREMIYGSLPVFVPVVGCLSCHGEEESRKCEG